jgi:hypothetical protein
MNVTKYSVWILTLSEELQASSSWANVQIVYNLLQQESKTGTFFPEQGWQLMLLGKQSRIIRIHTTPATGKRLTHEVKSGGLRLDVKHAEVVSETAYVVTLTAQGQRRRFFRQQSGGCRSSTLRFSRRLTMKRANGKTNQGVVDGVHNTDFARLLRGHTEGRHIVSNAWQPRSTIVRSPTQVLDWPHKTIQTPSDPSPRHHIWGSPSVNCQNRQNE